VESSDALVAVGAVVVRGGMVALLHIEEGIIHGREIIDDATRVLLLRKAVAMMSHIRRA
jgi:hypothetical protein